MPLLLGFQSKLKFNHQTTRIDPMSSLLKYSNFYLNHAQHIVICTFRSDWIFELTPLHWIRKKPASFLKHRLVNYTLWWKFGSIALLKNCKEKSKFFSNSKFSGPSVILIYEFKMLRNQDIFLSKSNCYHILMIKHVQNIKTNAIFNIVL